LRVPTTRHKAGRLTIDGQRLPPAARGLIAIAAITLGQTA
jgi:hypothetical protein